MFRNVLLVVMGLLALAASCLALSGQPEAMPIAIGSGLLLVAIAVERWRYQQAHGPLDAGWIKTDECFVDPESGKTLQVYYNPGSGERRYERS